MLRSRLLSPPPPDSIACARDLLAAAGYTHQLDDGLFSLLPLGRRVADRIAAGVRSELDQIGGQEISMPLIQPEAIWSQSTNGAGSRANAFGAQLFHLNSTRSGPLVLAPTHEEVATIVAAACVREPEDLPRLTYQVQPRFRDQACSGGLLQTREFVMADAYGFHADQASLDESYLMVKRAFAKVIARCGVQFVTAEADSGAMGGESEEFLAPLPGSDVIAAVRCNACGYCASVDVAPGAVVADEKASRRPRAETGDDAAIGTRLAAIPFFAGERTVLVLLPAWRSLNAIKLARALAALGVDPIQLHPASAEELRARGATYDWISVVRTPSNVLVVADVSVARLANFSFPAPTAGRVLRDLNAGRDFRVDHFADLAAAAQGDACPRCGAGLDAVQGVEVAHVFKLGTRFAVAFGACLPKSGGRTQPLVMGCYGLGVTRLMAVVAAQRADPLGLDWPVAIAPFAASLIPARPTLRHRARELHGELAARGLEVLLDDCARDPMAGRRYSDLIGLPWKLTLDTAATGDYRVTFEDRRGLLRGDSSASDTNRLACLVTSPSESALG